MAGTVVGSKPDTIFSFSDRHSIILCGYKDNNRSETYFSEFILQICGQDSILDFWDATQTCRLSVYKDTLSLIELKNLPTNINRAYKLTDWSIEKLFFDNGSLKRAFEIDRTIRKYTRQEIQETLQEFESARTGLGDNKIELANRLFIATISGDETARKYFKEFETTFGQLDGAFAEEYKDLKAMLELWTRE